MTKRRTGLTKKLNQKNWNMEVDNRQEEGNVKGKDEGIGIGKGKEESKGNI